MPLARRLLMVGGGSGSFSPPPETWNAAGNLVLDGSVVNVDTGSGFKAFPGLCWTPSGRLLLVYRHGTDHEASEDGYIAGRYSDDEGLTWGSPFTIYDTADDVRDPSLTTLSDDRIALSCFRYSGGLAYQSEVLFSDDNGATWGAPVVVTNFYAAESHTYDEVACSAPVVEISSTRYVLPVYAHDGAANWNSFAAISTDSGSTFDTLTLIATGGSKSWTEPWAVRLPDTSLYCLIRVDNLNQVWLATSADDGDTWTVEGSEWAGDSRNATVLTGHGALFTSGRDAGVQGQYATSWDDGATWETRTSLPSPSSNYMYAAIAQMPSGRIVAVWSQENSSTDADLYLQAFEDTGP